MHPDQCNVSNWYNKADQALKTAKKDNDFIYHERIPDQKSLKPIGKAVVAKPIALPEKLGMFLVYYFVARWLNFP